MKPICIPLNGSRPDPGSKLWVAGWGRTEQSMLMYVVELLNIKEYVFFYRYIQSS